MRLNKHQIYAAVDRKKKLVNMEEWGGDVEIQAMSVGQKLDFDKYVEENPEFKDMAFYLIIKSCIDEDGKPLFSEDDKQYLLEKSSESILQLFNECIALNKQKQNDVEEAAKNS